ncbi:hypothetical protein ACIPY3_22160 [Paenarthrobacter sp. NPDC089714]|uniref:hypothetical protein n=1 Tax=Paenarthrobacter sp. NPDC089714 TaxID=3364377 RepID=UPI00380D461A
MDPETAFTMALVAAIISGLSLLVGSASLLWNVSSWRRSGRQIELDIKVRATDGHQIIDYSPDQISLSLSTETFLQFMRSQGFGEVAILFTVRNVGRLPATVDDCLLATPAGQHVSIKGSWKGNTLPTRVEAGDYKEFIYPLEHFAKNVREHRTQVMTITPSVTLGTGRRVASRQKLKNYAVIGSKAPQLKIRGRHHDHGGSENQQDHQTDSTTE